MIFKALNHRLFLYLCLVTGGLFVAAYLVAGALVDEKFLEAQLASLQGGRQAFEALTAEKTKRLITGLQVAAENPAFRSALRQSPPRPSQLADLMERDLNRAVRGDIFVVTSPRANLLAMEQGGKVLKIDVPGHVAGAFDEVFGRSLTPDEPGVLSGFSAVTDKLYLTTTGPVLVEEKILGGLRAGYLLDDTFCAQLKEISGADTALFFSGKVLAGSLESDQDKALRSQADMLSRMPGREPFNIRLAGQKYLAKVFVLADPLGNPAGFQVVLREQTGRRALLAHLRVLLALLGVLALLLLALVAGPEAAKNLNRPIFQSRDLASRRPKKN